MPAPEGYHQAQGWYWPIAADLKNPTKSIFPNDEEGGWKTGDAKVFGAHKFNRTVQGWKLHVCVQPEAIESLFYALSPELHKLQASHKFAPFDAYRQDPETGKACVIYPMDPADLSVIVRRVEHVLANMEMLERRGHMAQAKRGMQPGPSLAPLQGGVQGDMRVGQSGYVYCRYGGFWGELVDADKIYDPSKGEKIEDKRNDVPYPAFIKSLPAEIQALT